MKRLAKYWMVLLALILAAAAVVVYIKGYQADAEAYQLEYDSLTQQISILQAQIASNVPYADIQDQIDGALEEIDASREKLFEPFPADILEEDQILYVLYLQEIFGSDIDFAFSDVVPLSPLNSGEELGGLSLTVNYETTYQEFKNLVDYLATDSRVTSVRYCTMTYDKATDTLSGSMTIVLYTVNAREYERPEIDHEDPGKDNIFSS